MSRSSSNTPSETAATPAQALKEMSPALLDIVIWLPEPCLRDDIFVEWTKRLLANLKPSTPLEEAAAARLVSAHWRLRAHLTDSSEFHAHIKLDDRTQAAAEQSLGRAEASWLRLRKMAQLAHKEQKQRGRSAAAKDEPPPSAASTRNTPLPGYEPPPPIPAETPINWRDYISVDEGVSADWPVLRGTNVWAESIASALQDGITEAELLRDHPFLNATQIRAVLLCDAEGMCGPWTRDGPTNAPSNGARLFKR